MTESERKAKLAEMTGGLKCRCPGFETMSRVQCKTEAGIRYCYFACERSDQPKVEFRHPVGEGNLCRCSLGTKIDPISIRFIEDEEATWGFAKCLQLQSQTAIESPTPKKSMLSIWPVAVGLGALIWYTTTKGK